MGGHGEVSFVGEVWVRKGRNLDGGEGRERMGIGMGISFVDSDFGWV